VRTISLCDPGAWALLAVGAAEAAVVADAFVEFQRLPRPRDAAQIPHRPGFSVPPSYQRTRSRSVCPSTYSMTKKCELSPPFVNSVGLPLARRHPSGVLDRRERVVDP